MSRSHSVSEPANLLEDYLAALMAGDSVRARHLIDDAIAKGRSVGDVYLSVLAPALHEIGERWKHGEVNVAYEHQATMITQGIVGALGPRMRVPPTSGRLAVVACTPGEQHALGAQMLAEFVEGEGWEVLLLGAATPASDLAALVDDERPDVVALSTSVVDNLPEAEGSLQALVELVPRPFVVVGGLAWRGRDADAARLGAGACFDDAEALVALLSERFPALPAEA